MSKQFRVWINFDSFANKEMKAGNEGQCHSLIMTTIFFPKSYFVLKLSNKENFKILKIRKRNKKIHLG